MIKLGVFAFVIFIGPIFPLLLGFRKGIFPLLQQFLIERQLGTVIRLELIGTSFDDRLGVFDYFCAFFLFCLELMVVGGKVFGERWF